MIPNDIKITPDLIASHGLKPDEYERILELIGREPTFTELGIFSAMWNEHCSYKSSKKWLKTLPTEGPRVLQGPGENAGVVDIGDGQAVVFKMESHNHPSYIEPYQGAATGVGGILRDVFTMGARPVAAMNALRFGEPDHPRTRHLVSGVVSGVGGYGNSFGVPTVGGEVEFHARYNGNCLVNAFAAGLAKSDAIFLAKAEASACRSSISAPRPAVTVLAARPWLRRSSTIRSKKSAPPFRLAILSPKNACWKRASSSWKPARSSPSRTWVRPVLPVPPLRWAPAATSASSWTSTRFRCAKNR